MTNIQKHIKIALITLLLFALTAQAIWLLIPEPIQIYDVGYIFYDYENDTDYIHPDAPYINVGGRVYFLAKENWYGGELRNVCQILSYIDYETGIPYSICESKHCMHNNIDYSRNCHLTYFSTDLNIDDQGWIYGSYHPGVLVTDVAIPYYGTIQDRTQDPGVPELGRFNLYDQSYQTLYLYETDTTQAGYLVTDSISGICTTYQYVYFFERLVPGRNGGQAESWLRRYDITTNTTQTLAEMYPHEHNGFYAFGDNLYLLKEDGLYRYDLDYSPESRVCMLDFSTAFFEPGRGISNLQFDSSSRMIYFLRNDGQLCRVKEYNYDEEAAVVDRRPHEIPHKGQVRNYQLTDDCIYYDLAERRWIGPVTDEGNIPGAHYANTDGYIYSLTYNQCLSDETVNGTVIWNDTSLYFKNWTVIGNYMYAEQFEEVPIQKFENYYRTDYCCTKQIRVDLTTGRVDNLLLTNWELISPKDN